MHFLLLSARSRIHDLCHQLTKVCADSQPRTVQILAGRWNIIPVLHLPGRKPKLTVGTPQRNNTVSLG